MNQQYEALAKAVGQLIKAKGRFHTEQNYKALVEAYDALPATHPITCNQMILLLEAYRGTLHTATWMGTKAADIQFLCDHKLLTYDWQLPEHIPTAEGQQFVRNLLGKS